MSLLIALLVKFCSSIRAFEKGNRLIVNNQLGSYLTPQIINKPNISQLNLRKIWTYHIPILTAKRSLKTPRKINKEI